MTDIDKQIRTRIDEFVLELSVLVRAAAVDAVRLALGGDATPVRSRFGANRGVRAGGVLGHGRRRGEKRDPAEIAKTVQSLGAYIAAHPGERIEQIARGLGAPSDDLKLPIKKLLRAETITKKGERRATTYFGGAGASGVRVARARIVKKGKRG